MGHVNNNVNCRDNKNEKSYFGKDKTETVYRTLENKKERGKYNESFIDPGIK